MGYERENDDHGMTAADPLACGVASALWRLTARSPLERNYRAAVEGVARALGGSLSLWRAEGDEQVLVAYEGGGRGGGPSPDEEVLARMKKAAAGALERDAADGPRGAQTERDGRDEAGGLFISPLLTSSGTWGALVFQARDAAAGAGRMLECVCSAFAMAAEIEQLHGEITSLRGRIAALEKDKKPDEHFATIGRLAAYSYQELEETLRAVEAELRREEGSGPSPATRECASELRRARGIVADQLDLARLEMPVLKLKDLNEVLEESLREVEDRVHSKGLRLMKRLSPEIPRLLLDEDKIKLAIHKVLGAAAARSAPEGWLRVETAARGGDVSLQVVWQEKAPPGEANEEMFLPFGPLDRGGVGMIVASQIIREHGGGVRVRRYESGSTALILDFPIKSNQDRRRRRSRRSGLDRRRPTAA